MKIQKSYILVQGNTAVLGKPRGTLCKVEPAEIVILANTFAIKCVLITLVLFNYHKKPKHLYRQLAQLAYIVEYIANLLKL